MSAKSETAMLTAASQDHWKRMFRLAEAVGRCHQVDDLIRERDEFKRQRDGLLGALSPFVPNLPEHDAACHRGIVRQAECANCQRITRVLAAIAACKP